MQHMSFFCLSMPKLSVKSIYEDAAEAAQMASMDLASTSLNSDSDWPYVRPSLRAREKLAIIPPCLDIISLASSRLYPPDRATTRMHYIAIDIYLQIIYNGSVESIFGS